MNFCAPIQFFYFKLSCSIVQAIFKMLLCCGFLGNTTKCARILIFDFGAPGVPPKGPRKLKFMEPIRVWYQVNTRDPTPTIFVPPPENQLMLWNVSDGTWSVCVSVTASAHALESGDVRTQHWSAAAAGLDRC